MAQIRLHAGLARTIQEDRQLHQILIGESMRAVIAHGGRPVEIGGSDLRRQGMKLQDQQPETADVRSPAGEGSFAQNFVARLCCASASTSARRLARKRFSAILLASESA